MNKYVALLRGINVAGQKKIKMADLKSLCEKIGLNDVTTYIQSGNVIFTHTQSDEGTIKINIEKAISDKYGFNVHIEVIKAASFKNRYSSLPFKSFDIEADGTKILLTFLSDQPVQSNFDALLSYTGPSEELILGEKVAYLHCPTGYGKTKLSNALIENKLNVSATTRNLKTVNILCKMLENNH